MMAYQSDFVIAILHDGRPVHERNNREVYLPFNAEYKIRLKNKHPRLRAKATVYVDGRKASNLGDIILAPGQTLDLERFLDHSLTEGNKFQFVPLSDERVSDPTDSANGIVLVDFYREVDFSHLINWNPNKVTYYPPLDSTPKPWYDQTTGGLRSNISWISHNNNVIGSASVNCSTMDSYPTKGSNGATVEGGLSGQTFVQGDWFSTETSPVSLKLTLKGITTQAQVPNTAKVRFCSNCGRRRSYMADTFCPRCGTAYSK